MDNTDLIISELRANLLGRRGSIKEYAEFSMFSRGYVSNVISLKRKIRPSKRFMTAAGEWNRREKGVSDAHTAPPGDDLAESAPEHGSSPQKPLEGLISKNEIEQFLSFSPDTRRALIRIGEIMDEARRADSTDVGT